MRETILLKITRLTKALWRERDSIIHPLLSPSFFIYLSALSYSLSAYLSVHLSVCLSVCLSLSLSRIHTPRFSSISALSRLQLTTLRSYLERGDPWWRHLTAILSSDVNRATTITTTTTGHVPSNLLYVFTGFFSEPAHTSFRHHFVCFS